MADIYTIYSQLKKSSHLLNNAVQDVNVNEHLCVTLSARFSKVVRALPRDEEEMNGKEEVLLSLRKLYDDSIRLVEACVNTNWISFLCYEESPAEAFRTLNLRLRSIVGNLNLKGLRKEDYTNPAADKADEEAIMQFMSDEMEAFETVGAAAALHTLIFAHFKNHEYEAISKGLNRLKRRNAATLPPFKKRFLNVLSEVIDMMDKVDNEEATIQVLGGGGAVTMVEDKVVGKSPKAVRVGSRDTIAALPNSPQMRKSSSVVSVQHSAQNKTIQTEIVDWSSIKIIRELACGGFAKVYEARKDGERVAVKKLTDQLGAQAHTDLLNEVEIQAPLRSGYIIGVYGVCLKPPNMCMVMEMAERGDLFQLLRDESHDLPWRRRWGFARDAALAMNYLHSHKPYPILHRDLKSGNFIITANWSLKLTDFGLSCYRKPSMAQKNTSAADAFTGGTVRWTAPEVLTGDSAYIEAADMYSYALILYEIATRAIPFDNVETMQVATHVQNGGRPVWPTNGSGQAYDPHSTYNPKDNDDEDDKISQTGDQRDIPDDFKKLTEWCWTHDHKKRPTFKDIIKWFDARGQLEHTDLNKEHKEAVEKMEDMLREASIQERLRARRGDDQAALEKQAETEIQRRKDAEGKTRELERQLRQLTLRAEKSDRDKEQALKVAEKEKSHAQDALDKQRKGEKKQKKEREKQRKAEKEKKELEREMEGLRDQVRTARISRTVSAADSRGERERASAHRDDDFFTRPSASSGSGEKKDADSSTPAMPDVKVTAPSSSSSSGASTDRSDVSDRERRRQERIARLLERSTPSADYSSSGSSSSSSSSSASSRALERESSRVSSSSRSSTRTDTGRSSIYGTTSRVKLTGDDSRMGKKTISFYSARRGKFIEI